MKGPVQAEPGIDIAREIGGRGDDRFQARANKRIAMRLAARERARVTAQKGKVRSEILTKRHVRYDSSSKLRVF